MADHATPDWTHPTSGRIYREGDPAHHFATLARILAEQARRFADTHDRRMADRDYLDQHTEWLSDLDRIARAMAHTIAELDRAYTAVTVDRDMPSYGLGKRDEEWQRKYGPIRPDQPPPADEAPMADRLRAMLHQISWHAADAASHPDRTVDQLRAELRRIASITDREARRG